MMSMHMEGPWLSLTGKKKGKVKYKSSAEAQRAKELEANWKDLKTRWGVEAEDKKRKRALAAPAWTEPTPAYRGAGQVRNSVDTGWVACTRVPNKVYTGTKVLGIGTMHKSNAVPIFSEQEALDVSTMRRN